MNAKEINNLSVCCCVVKSVLLFSTPTLVQALDFSTMNDLAAAAMKILS